MVNWQVTTTTIYCDAVADEVTVLVYRDGSTRCTGYDKYNNPGQDTDNLLKKRSKELNRTLECDGPQCHRVTGYRDRLFAEESSDQRKQCEATD
jgi:hypothetical protein